MSETRRVRMLRLVKPGGAISSLYRDEEYELPVELAALLVADQLAVVVGETKEVVAESPATSDDPPPTEHRGSRRGR